MEDYGMSYESLHITYTADSCLYDYMKEGVHNLNKFKLSETDKASILTKLRECKFDKVRSKEYKNIKHDAGSISVYLNSKTADLQINAGCCSYISSNSDGFDKGYTYLVDFARQKR